MNFANGKQIGLSGLKKFCQNFANYSSIEVEIEGNRRYLVNVPADGWCLLYSFIASYNALPGSKVSISDLCVAILRQFQLKCQTKSLPYEFLTMDDSAELIASHTDSIEEVFKFYLIRYLTDKHYDTFVLDYLPQLIADYFKCDITIYTLGSGSLVFKSEDQSQCCIEILFCPDLSHFMPLLTTNKIYHHYQTEHFELSLNNQFYRQIFDYYYKNLGLINNQVEYFRFKCRLESKLYVYELKKHKLIEQFEIYAFAKTELRARYEEKFTNINNLDNFIKNCAIYSKELDKSQDFINSLIDFYSLDERLAHFLSLVLKLSSLRGMYAQVQLVLKLKHDCILVKIPNFGIQVDRLPLRIKLIIYTLNNRDFSFCFLNSLRQVLDLDKNFIGPKSTLAHLYKK